MVGCYGIAQQSKTLEPLMSAISSSIVTKVLEEWRILNVSGFLIPLIDFAFWYIGMAFQRSFCVNTFSYLSRNISGLIATAMASSISFEVGQMSFR